MHFRPSQKEIKDCLIANIDKLKEIENDKIKLAAVSECMKK
jgi:hypothetical protein